MAGKSTRANLFGTFLDTVSSGRSKSDLDISKLAQSVINWSKLQDAGEGAVSRVLRALEQQSSSSSIGALVRATGLDLDTVLKALDDAAAKGLIKSDTSEDGHLYRLTASGRDVLT
jgi:DNA-binding MarR family transcriptional regulator